MNVLVFKTDIKTRKNVKVVQPIFNNHPVILDWSVDTEDIDNVLRIETSDNMTEKDVIVLLSTYGFNCVPLAD